LEEFRWDKYDVALILLLGKLEELYVEYELFLRRSASTRVHGCMKVLELNAMKAL